MAKLYRASNVRGGRPYIKDVPPRTNRMNYYCPNCKRNTYHKFADAYELYDFWRCEDCGAIDFRNEYDHLIDRRSKR